MSIKLWDWDRDFECVQVFEGHGHYVMMVKINPRDTNTFASASLDKTIKVWGLTANTPHFSLEGHEKGVNCLDYYPGGDKPYLLSGADDRTVKIWDYQTKACLQTLEGHAHNVSSVCFHPRLPMIITASEDGTVRLWHSTTYRPETTLNYGLERAWCIAATKDANKIAIGYDEGTVVLKLGNERPVASLDTNTGKLVWALSHDIQTMSVKGLGKEVEIVDGERLQLAARDLGACEVYPQTVQHNSNGSFIVVCGDGEYIIYTSQALRNKAFGSALDFVWSSQGTGDYAIRESTSRVRTFKNFKDHKQITLPISSADGIFGGVCLGIKGPDCIVFFDWEDGTFIRKIDVSPTAIFWNETGDSLVLVCSDCFYTLRYDRDVVANALASGSINPDEGVDGSFELVSTINERAHTGQWVGECFLYTNSGGKLNYVVGGEVMTLCHLDHPMYLLGYVPKEDRAFLVDKTYNVFSYKLLLSMLSYQSAVVRKDFVTANSLLPLIPKSEYGAVARFLESQGFKEEALAVTTDLDHKFELAVDLRHMATAHAVLAEQDSKESQLDLESTEMQSKWRRLGDLALSNGDIALAEQCAKRSADLSGLLLLYTSAGNKPGMQELAVQARQAGRFNVAFLAYFLTGQVEEVIELLLEANRIPEAAFMARTYMPSQISRVLALWKADLKLINEKAAEALADPEKYPNLFPDLEWALKVRVWLC
jgi:coatomer subunit beta'